MYARHSTCTSLFTSLYHINAPSEAGAYTGQTLSPSPRPHCGEQNAAWPARFDGRQRLVGSLREGAGRVATFVLPNGGAFCLDDIPEVVQHRPLYVLLLTLRHSSPRRSKNVQECYNNVYEKDYNKILGYIRIPTIQKIEHLLCRTCPFSYKSAQQCTIPITYMST